METCLRPKSRPLKHRDSDIGDIAEPPLVVDQGFDDDEEELEVNEELARAYFVSCS